MEDLDYKSTLKEFNQAVDMSAFGRAAGKDSTPP
jgi:hypothetical protein